MKVKGCPAKIFHPHAISKENRLLKNIQNGSVLPAVKRTGLCQIVCQARSLGAYLLFACVSLDVISLLLVVINPFATNNYKRPVWTVDPGVAGSTPVGLGFEA
ncbi:MAG: hypothetical protein KAR11_02200 [Phycisphaerae bacterium]|nr:hypothetical protein [Phycisphaerae bacterium]